MTPACPAPLGLPALLDYWVDGLDADAIDVHLLACGACSATLRALVPVLDGLRELRRHTPAPVVTAAQVAALRAEGVRVTARSAPAHGELRWQVDDADLFILAVPLELAGVERIALEYLRDDGELMMVLPETPLPADGELLIACDRHIATAHAALRFRVRGHTAAGERVLAELRVVREAAPAPPA